MEENKRKALIAGGSSDIANKIIEYLLDKGYYIYATYNNCKNLIENENIKWIRYDASKLNTFNDAISQIDKNDKIDLVINCIGKSMNSLLIDTKVEDIVNMININEISTILFTKFAIKRALELNYGCKIINITSIWGVVGASCESIYALTKGAIEIFSKSVAKEYAKMNIYINTIAPGYIDTKMNNYTNEEKKAILSEIPLNSFGKPEDVVKGVDYLINANYVTGETLNINGGWI